MKVTDYYIKKSVSIPYGTIKRRLYVCYFSNTLVSIPYGTIKRPVFDKCDELSKSFNSLWYD